MSKPAKLSMEEHRWKCAKAATLAESRTSDAVAAAALENAPQAIIVKDFQPTKIFYMNRPCLTTVEKDRSDQSLTDAALRLLDHSVDSSPVVALRAMRGLPLISSLA